MTVAVDVLLALVVASLGVDVVLGRAILRLRDRVLALELEHGERLEPPRRSPPEELWLE